MKRVTIHVEEHHIEKGIPFEVCDCPIAIAVREQLGWKNPVVSIGSGTVFDGVPGRFGDAIPLPKKAVRWAQRFDLGAVVGPMTFDLEIPE